MIFEVMWLSLLLWYHGCLDSGQSGHQGGLDCLDFVAFYNWIENEWVEWMKEQSNEDQLADDMTKTQVSSKLLPHFNRTLIKVPDSVKGYRSTAIGNR